MTQLSLARLTVITALALCLPYPAQAYDWNTRYNCANQRSKELIAAGDPRWRRMIKDATRRGGGWEVAGHVTRNTADGRAATRDLDRYCAARGQ